MSRQQAANKRWDKIIGNVLKKMLVLQDNWDGDGSLPPSMEMVFIAIDLAKLMKATGTAPPTRVHPSTNGTIYFEWYTPCYWELEITRGGRIDIRKAIKR